MTDNKHLIDALVEFISHARWFGGKGRPFEVTDVRRVGAVGAGPTVLVDLVELTYADTGDVELYQLPLAVYPDPQDRLDHALITEVDVADHGHSFVYDAVHDRDAMAHLLRAFAAGVTDGGPVAEGELVFHRLPGYELDLDAHSTLFSGEQSNSSVMFGEDSLLKVFRKVTPGINPDVSIHEVLTRAGSDNVAALYGWLEIPGRAGAEPLQLAMLQQFLRTASDGWDLALTSVRNLFAEADLHADEVGGDFAAEAARLGEALADVHRVLAEHFPTAERTSAEMSDLGAAMAARLDAAAVVVPALAPYADALHATFDDVASMAGTPVQQIHGDLHLGQTLRTVRGLEDRGLRGRARQDPRRAGAARLPVARRGRHAPVLRLRPEGRRGRPRRQRRRRRAARVPGGGVVDAQLRRLPRRVCRTRADRRRAGAARRVRRRQGGLRGGLRSAQPTQVGAHPDGGHREPGREERGMSELKPVDRHELDLLIEGRHGHPHAILGPHPHDGGVTVRVFKPLASSVVVRHDGTETRLEHEYAGFWSAVLVSGKPTKGKRAAAVPVSDVPDYRLAVAYDGGPHEVDDPYRFLPTLGETDLHLINEGRHELLWDVLGSHVHHYESALGGGVSGTAFAVWAPGAKGVRLKADFNSWDGREHPMRQLGQSGVWELFVPGVGSGTHYKYSVLGADDVWTERADPMASYAEQPPLTASVVYESSYSWNDQAWMESRAGRTPHAEPMSVYEVHLASWRRPYGATLNYGQLADELVGYVSDLGFTHVEFMPVMQHPFGGSWGYHVTSYFAPDSRFGDPDGFRYLVDRLHQAGIGVLLDWVPGHFATDEWALARFDGTPLYEDPNPQRGWHKEWGSHIFNFGRHEVRNFLYANALYWLEEFHADGLRVDGVASMLYLDYSREEGEWTPNQYGGRENLEAVQFLQEMNATVYRRVPGAVTIAEESTSWPGVTRPTSSDGLGFGFKWNMGWMNDSLRYMSKDPIYRSHHHGEMTFSLVYAFSENFVLPISHDEVVHGKGSLLRKMPGDRWQQLANLRAFLAYMWAHPGKQLLFMGSEFGQESEWAESRELDWWLLEHSEHLGVHSLVKDLNRAYVDSPALWAADVAPDGFQWIDADDTNRSTFSFLRRGAGGTEVVCVANFSAIPHGDYRIGLPSAGTWEEILNTDAQTYTGSGVGNLGAVEAHPDGHQGQPASATIVVPPLATIYLRKA